MTYTLEHGSYYQRNPRNNDIEKMCDQVTLAFSRMPDDGKPDPEGQITIHRHGTLENVQAWWKKNHEAARPLFGEIILITFPPKFDPARINEVIEIPARLGILLKEVEDEEPARVTSTWDWIGSR